MNSSHVAVGTGGISAMAALTQVLTGFHGLDHNQASGWAWIICFVVGGIVALLMMYFPPKPPAQPPEPPQPTRIIPP